MLKRGAGFVKRRCFGKRARYLPAKKVLEAQRAEMAGKTAADCGLPTIQHPDSRCIIHPEKYLREFLDSFVNQTAPNGSALPGGCLRCRTCRCEAHRGGISGQRINASYTKRSKTRALRPTPTPRRSWPRGNIWRWPTTMTSLHPTPCTPWASQFLQLRAQGEPDGFLYSDEALFQQEHPAAHGGPLQAGLRPGLSAVLQLHLPLWRCSKKALWDELGGERPECDGSQDHDLFLRLLEQTGGAAHVPQVLYYWRVHAGLHLRRHRCQALCGGSGQKGAGRPSGPHRPHRHRGGWACSPAPIG